MSQTMAVDVPVEPEFWEVLTSDEMERAGAILQEALLKSDYDEVSLLAEHLGKYITTNRGVFVDESESVQEVDFNQDKAGGTVYVSFDVSVHMGCKDIDGSDQQDEEIRFSIDADKRTLQMHVLEHSLESWDE